MNRDLDENFSQGYHCKEVDKGAHLAVLGTRHNDQERLTRKQTRPVWKIDAALKSDSVWKYS